MSDEVYFVSKYLTMIFCIISNIIIVITIPNIQLLVAPENISIATKIILASILVSLKNVQL